MNITNLTTTDYIDVPLGFLLAPWPQMCVVPEAVWLCPISGLVGAEETNEGHASCGRSLKECNLCDNRFQFRRTFQPHTTASRGNRSRWTKWYISRALFLWLLFWNSRAEHMKLSTWLKDFVFYWQLITAKIKPSLLLQNLAKIWPFVWYHWITYGEKTTLFENDEHGIDRI